MTGWELIDGFLVRLGVRIGPASTGQTTGGTHAPDSWHYKGQARDYGASNSDTAAITAALLPYATGTNAQIIELFDSRANVFMKDGAAITPSDELRQDHYDHVHAALAPAADLTGAVAQPAGLFSGAAAAVRGLAIQAVIVGAGIVLVALGAWRAAGSPRVPSTLGVPTT